METIKQYLDSKKITGKELEEKFVLVKKIEVEDRKCCPVCGDNANQYRYDSEPWTGVTWCIVCDSLLYTIFGDRMGGSHTDTVFVYDQKDKPTYKKYFLCADQKNYIECRICGTKSSDTNDIETLFCKTCNRHHK